MNPSPAPEQTHEQSNVVSQQPQMSEIPSYPIDTTAPEQAYLPNSVPAQEQYEQPAPYVPEQAPVPQHVETLPVAHVTVEQVKPLEPEFQPQSHEGELGMHDSERVQPTFPGGISVTSVTSKLTGYPVASSYTNDPLSGLLQQAAQKGDPRQAVVWQMGILGKILAVLSHALGI